MSTISTRLETIKTAIGFLGQADLLARADLFANSLGLLTPDIANASTTDEAQGLSILRSLPHGAEVAYVADTNLVQDLIANGLTTDAAKLMIKELTKALGLPRRSLASTPDAQTDSALHVTAREAAKDLVPHIQRLLNANWNNPLAGIVNEIERLGPDYTRWIAAGASPAQAIYAVANDVLNNAVP
jgi:hypothetical protein